MADFDYQRPTATQSLLTRIRMFFEATANLRSPAMFSVQFENARADKATIVIGDETFQFLSTGGDQKLTNDAYIAVKSAPGWDAYYQTTALHWALSRNDISLLPGGAWTPKLTDGVTAAPVWTRRKLVTFRNQMHIATSGMTLHQIFCFNGYGNDATDMKLKGGDDQIPTIANPGTGDLQFFPTVNGSSYNATQPFVGDMGAEIDTNDLTLTLIADADERTDVDLFGTLYRVEIVPALDDAGHVQLTITTTPVLGTGADSPTPTPLIVPHDENMDTWQTEVGRGRQDASGSSEDEFQDDQLLFDGKVL